jgi:hypothetical protein
MSALRFEPRVQYSNQLLLPLGLYPPIHVPPGMTVYAPIFVSAREMQRLAPSRTIRVVAGLTEVQFSLRFANFSHQWQQTRSGGSATRWQFQGGAVCLDLTVSLYVAEGFQQDARIFATIMEHELLHVYDEIDLVKRYMPAEAVRDQYVQRYLIERRVIDDSMFQHWFRSSGFEQWIRDGIWAPEHNRRGQVRDSGPEWNRYREKIDAFMRASP